MKILEILKSKRGMASTSKRWDVPIGEIATYSVTDFMEYVTILQQRNVKLSAKLVQHTAVLTFMFLHNFDDVREINNLTDVEIQDTWQIVSETLKEVSETFKIKFISFNNLLKLLNEMANDVVDTNENVEV